ncbi:hypothetical protein GF312_09385 [Candidatus Poribacteria bacterium]|nr:hypothetical protein [Candidatus Poribacteria bacterium]
MYCIKKKSLNPPVFLPDGSEFKTWEEQLSFTKTYWVDNSNPSASDDNPGSRNEPFRSINRAAKLLQPGERVVVKAGVYRECVKPVRGGLSPDKMISYQAEPGVIIKGSESVTGGWEFAEEWNYSRDEYKIWTLELDKLIKGSYNPFGVINLPKFVAQTCFTPLPELMSGLLGRRGLVFQDGKPLKQVSKYSDLHTSDGTYWTEANGQVIHVRFYDDIDPDVAEIEITTREQAFAPVEYGLGFIHVSGFAIEQVADGFPWPQRAALSTMRGHHWIIEDNTIRWSNALGIDVGRSEVDMKLPEKCGYHIVRRNTVEDCGICGIAGTGPLKETLIEENQISRCGWHNVERYYECAGIKTHHNHDTLIRRNVIRDMMNASGIWMDYGNQNSRCCENVIINTDSIFGGIFMEASHIPCMVDNNFIWGSTSHGIYEHDTDYLTIAHNFIAHADGAGICLKLGQTDRWVNGRGATARKHRVLNNVITNCGRLIEISNIDNVSDGNIFGSHSEQGPLRILRPVENHNFKSWQDFMSWDLNGVQGNVEAAFDPEALILKWYFDGEIPECEPVEGILEDIIGTARPTNKVEPGPFAKVPDKPSQIYLDPRRHKR